MRASKIRLGSQIWDDTVSGLLLAHTVGERNIRAVFRRITDNARAQVQFRSLSVPLRTGGGQDQAGQGVIGQIYKSLDSSRDELNAAARAMGVDTKLRTP